MTKLLQEQLNNLSKEELVAETLKLQDQYIDLSQKVDFFTEQIMLMNQRQFGRNVVNGRFCPQSVRNFCPIVAGFNAGTYKVPACVL